MLSNDLIKLIDQLWSFKGDKRCSLLKVLNSKNLIVVTIAVPIRINMIAETAGNVNPVVRNRFSIQKHQHAFKVCQAVTQPAPVQVKSPPVTLCVSGIYCIEEANWQRSYRCSTG